MKLKRSHLFYAACVLGVVAVVACGSESTSGFEDGTGVDAGRDNSSPPLIVPTDGSVGNNDGSVVNGCKPKDCAALGVNCGKQNDGCGNIIECGTCKGPETCGGGETPSRCGGTGGCVAKTCTELGASCGPQGDGCGGSIECGTCPSGQICGGGGASKCGVPTISSDGGTCTPKSCIEQGKNCGFLSDGCGNLLQCGTTCPGSTICGGGGVANVCGGGGTCTPTTCPAEGKNCGPMANGCGGLLDCGTCATGSCGGGGTANVCGSGTGGGGCTGLCTQQVKCDAGPATSVSGVVFAPNGTLPLYDALVYVPNGPVQAFAPGLTCDQCSAQASGNPLVSTRTNAKGEFTLSDMPVGTNIPLVIQLGRWRRQVTITNVPACTNTALPATITRLPRTRTEGDIPKIAVTTGGADALQCFLLKLGIAQSEFTQPGDPGRVNVFAGQGGASRYSNNFNGYTGGARDLPSQNTIFGSVAEISKYDVAVLTCEGNNDKTDTYAPYRANMKAYADAGGRIFASHWHHSWLEDGPTTATPTWPATATFNHLDDLSSPQTFKIDQSFPRGVALAAWLNNVQTNALPLGDLQIVEAQHTITAANPATSRRFVYKDSPVQVPSGDNGGNTNSVQALTVDTPVESAANAKCGRVFVADFHISTGNEVATSFPNGCTANGALTDQEKVLAFMFFDLTSCIQTSGPPACTARTCTQQNIGCGQAGDGCGGTINCGNCPAGQTCGGGGVPSQCGAPSCTARTCVGQGFSCGLAGDGCGGSIDCGPCTVPGQVCGGAGLPNVCGNASCAPTTCQAKSAVCGKLGDGCGNLLDCGTCPPNAVCQNNECVPPACTPRSCEAQGFNCGLAPNGCGDLVDCGTCESGTTCGGAGIANRCGTIAR